jgi:DNA-nicking Smr family endonuclease
MKELNLHRTKHNEVKRQVIRFIEDNWNTGNRIKIITGHSLKMKKIVKDIIKEYDLKYQEGDFLGINKGFLTLYME